MARRVECYFDTINKLLAFRSKVPRNHSFPKCDALRIREPGSNFSGIFGAWVTEGSGRNQWEGSNRPHICRDLPHMAVICLTTTYGGVACNAQWQTGSLWLSLSLFLSFSLSLFLSFSLSLFLSFSLSLFFVVYLSLFVSPLSLPLSESKDVASLKCCSDKGSAEKEGQKARKSKVTEVSAVTGCVEPALNQSRFPQQTDQFF